MVSKKLLLFCALIGSLSGTLAASPVRGPVAAATVSHRVLKPGQHLELLVAVRNAQPPVSAVIECPAGLGLRRNWKLQHLYGAQDIYLLSFQLNAKAIGDYEIPSIRVTTGMGAVYTKPVFLHVSNDVKPPLPDARELALATDIPMSLAQEVVKTCPTPAPKPSPSPSPKDGRPLHSRLISSIGHGLSWFWNYPGK
jgi:hypothetical protein